MALTVKYQLDPATVSATLKRTVGDIFNPSSIFDTVELTVGNSSYTYSDGVDGTVYGFFIEATDSSGDTISGNPFNMVYKEDTGPGNQQTVTRGYFDYGVYEFLTTQQFGMTPDQVRAEVVALGYPNMGLSYTGPETGWYKCLVEGKVIFIPKNYFVYLDGAITEMNETRVRKSGLISVGSNGKNSFENCPVVTINGLRYRWRAMKHWKGEHADLNSVIRDCLVINYDSKTEMDLALIFTANTTAGYDPSLKGALSNGATVPPFVAGNDNLAFGPTSNAGAMVLGNSNWPNAGGTFRLIGTDHKWYQLTSAIYGAKMIPVLELLD